MIWIKFGVIYPHRLQDYNVLVLKKDAEIFLETHVEVKFDFKPTQMKKFKLYSDSKPAYKHISERKYHWIDSLFVSTKWLSNVKKIARKVPSSL